MFIKLFVSFCLSSLIMTVPSESLQTRKSLNCIGNGDCIDRSIEEIETNKQNKMDCNNTDSEPITYFNQLTDEFGNGVGNVSIANLNNLLSTLIEKENTLDKIQREVDEVFRGVIVAVILFGVCASVCLITACIYCCKINISDAILKKDVEALAEKLKRDCRFKKTIKKPTRDPGSESCNIIVEEAGVFVV